jgi:hypothetical protein
MQADASFSGVPAGAGGQTPSKKPLGAWRGIHASPAHMRTSTCSGKTYAHQYDRRTGSDATPLDARP